MEVDTSSMSMSIPTLKTVESARVISDSQGSEGLSQGSQQGYMMGSNMQVGVCVKKEEIVEMNGDMNTRKRDHDSFAFVEESENGKGGDGNREPASLKRDGVEDVQEAPVRLGELPEFVQEVWEQGKMFEYQRRQKLEEAENHRPQQNPLERSVSYTSPYTIEQTKSSHPQHPTSENYTSVTTPQVSNEINNTGPPRSPGGSRRSSTTSLLTDAGSATPSLRGSPPPSNSAPGFTQPPTSTQSAFTAMNGNIPPPPKRAKLTFAEREVRRIEKEFKDQERAAEKARLAEERAKKEAERLKNAEEKARKDAEREAEKEERRLKLEAEKAAKEERKRKKEEERKAKEEEKHRAEEEKRKKERSQKTLSSFFVTPATNARRNSMDGNGSGNRSMSPMPSNPSLIPASSPAASASASTPSKKDISTCDKMFPAFFIQPHVTMAPISRFERDKDAIEALQSMLDSYIINDRSPGQKRTFDAMELFHLIVRNNIPRGRQYLSVREIMTEFSGNPSRPIDLTSDSQNTQIKKTGDLLKKLPLKFLKFQEDVRPPYKGTYTSRPKHGIKRLARKPFRRDLTTTDYDYDSEAEWVEDDEDAEDLENDDGEDEDIEMGEAGDDLDGFLDDEGDETLNSKRLNLQNNVEPVSTGLCWEDHHRKSTNVKMMPYRMEIILGKFSISSISNIPS